MNLVIIALTFAVCIYADAAAVEKRQCGIPAIKPDTSTDIVGGKDAIPYSWPWQVLLRRNNIPFCGASLITNQWLITAAHCVFDSKPSAFSAVLSVFNKTRNDEPGEQISSITQFHVHPEFEPQNLVNDIALMKLSSPVNFTDHISPVCLSSIQGEELPAVGTNVFITGWGNTKVPSRDPSATLKQAVVPLMSTEVCRVRNPAYPKFDEKAHFCIGFDRGGKGACHGDSGGPAMFQTPDGSWKQIGITSFGQYGVCASPAGTGYTKVPSYVDFIKKYVHDLD